MRQAQTLVAALLTALLLAGCFDAGTPAVQKSRPTAEDEDPATTRAEADDGATGGGTGSSGSGGADTGSGSGAPTTAPAPTTSAAPAPPESIPAPEILVTFELLGPSAAPNTGNPTASAAGFRIEPAMVNISTPSFLVGTVKNSLPADAPDQAPMNFTIPSLNVTLPPIKKGQTLTFEVRVDAAGSYEYFIDGPRAEHDTYKAIGLKGTLNAAAPAAG